MARYALADVSQGWETRVQDLDTCDWDYMDNYPIILYKIKLLSYKLYIE
jgi:hypothetical protein